MTDTKDLIRETLLSTKEEFYEVWISKTPSGRIDSTCMFRGRPKDLTFEALTDGQEFAFFITGSLTVAVNSYTKFRDALG